MKLDILLITYNQENYIRECLDSILMQQTSFIFNVVVADDCSTDNTLDIIKEYSEKTNLNFTFLTNTNNLGAHKNYKRGIEACRSEYMAIMEGDDYWSDPYRLEKMISFLDNHHECSMAFNRIVFFYEYKSDFGIHDWTSTEDYEYITSKQMALKNRIGNLSACIFRRHIFDKFNSDLFDLDVMTDWILGLLFGQHGFVAHLKDPMSVYRVHGKGIWSGMSNDAQFKETFECIKTYNKYLDYKYNDEFLSHEVRLKKALGIAKERSILEYIPPLFISLAKILLPPCVMRKIR